MAKTEMVLEMYARNLHIAHERRTRGSKIITPWELLGEGHREEYLAVAANIHSALYLGEGDTTATAAYLVTHYKHQDKPEAQSYWERRVREAQGEW